MRLFTRNPFGYSGYYYDADLALYYLNSRYYDSYTGRFISADGYVSTGQGLIGSNMYAYLVFDCAEINGNMFKRSKFANIVPGEKDGDSKVRLVLDFYIYRGGF